MTSPGPATGIIDITPLASRNGEGREKTNGQEIDPYAKVVEEVDAGDRVEIAASNEPPDWIDSFLRATAGLPSPNIYRLWGAIYCIGAALERRVWLHTNFGRTYPNLFVLLVGGPGVGKNITINRVRKLLHSTDKMFLAPNDMTKAALLDELQAAGTRKVMSDGTLLQYNCLTVACTEFSTVVPTHDTEFLNTLTDLYDNLDSFKSSRRTSTTTDITNPQINILGGCTPGYLDLTLPEEAWQMGFMARIIMIYSGEGPRIDIFGPNPMDDPRALGILQDCITAALDLQGQCPIHVDAQQALQEWYDSGMEPVPKHSKLEHYKTRRLQSVLKLCIISAISRNSSGMGIQFCDVQRARDWLLAAETTMPDIFRSMVGRSDGEVLSALWRFAHAEYARTKSKPIPGHRLLAWLSQQTTSNKVQQMLDLAVKMDYLGRVAGKDEFIPRPRQDHGLE